MLDGEETRIRVVANPAAFQLLYDRVGPLQRLAKRRAVPLDFPAELPVPRVLPVEQECNLRTRRSFAEDHRRGPQYRDGLIFAAGDNRQAAREMRAAGRRGEADVVESVRRHSEVGNVLRG